MKHLANKGTRLFAFWVLTLCTIGGFIYGAVNPEVVRMPTWDQGTKFIEWLFMVYGISEVGGKGAEAYRDRQ